MVVYYEAQGGEPPAHVIVRFARALSVSADQLLGLEYFDRVAPKDVRLWKRLLKVEKFNDRDRRFVAQMIDALEAKYQAVEG